MKNIVIKKFFLCMLMKTVKSVLNKYKSNSNSNECLLDAICR